jgi:hypothetical protein
MRRALSVLARTLLAVAIGLAAYGWQDRVRDLPGPRVALALPLREAGHHGSAALLGLLVVWLAAFAVIARVAPPRHRLRAGLLRAGLAGSAVLGLQAASLQVTRQATFGFDWPAAAATAAPWLVAACALAATALTPRAGRAAG